MSFKPWQLVVVPFPFTDRSATKQRPALVISSEAFNQQTSHIVCLMVTTAKPVWAFDVKLSDWQSAGLNAPSIVRMKSFTLDTRLVRKSLSQLSPQDREAVRSAFLQAITLSVD